MIGQGCQVILLVCKRVHCQTQTSFVTDQVFDLLILGELLVCWLGNVEDVHARLELCSLLVLSSQLSFCSLNELCGCCNIVLLHT